MEPPGVVSAPSLELATAISSFDQHPHTHSPRNCAAQGCIISNVDLSRDLLYEQLYNMIAQEEREGYRCTDYLRHYSPRTIDESCRTLICAWMYNVVDEFEIDRESESMFYWYNPIFMLSLSSNNCFILINCFHFLQYLSFVSSCFDSILVH